MVLGGLHRCRNGRRVALADSPALVGVLHLSKSHKQPSLRWATQYRDPVEDAVAFYARLSSDSSGNASLTGDRHPHARFIGDGPLTHRSQVVHDGMSRQYDLESVQTWRFYA
jgi:hypothetical protein